MSQIFNSRQKTKKPWLDSLYVQRKNRTLELGKKSIDELIKQGVRISYRNIAEISKQIDDEKRGIHANSIKSNPDLYNYYQENVQKKEKIKKTLTNSFKSELLAKNYNIIKPDRDLNSLRSRYKKYTKQELVELLISAEEYIANNNNKWIISEFEKHKE
ncbi:hypothetical protein QYF52_15590 [Paenibacillus polymyxa]|uniref:hypothetical protein n=1 Tax=Paenibacillus polymyxa TaxID=1406 RepID=UPI0025B73342|nr:hypothetical protein [Paenibacillus polymyxa]MDN4079370.1 hypothetical protein [Paenibacillus polymyxa]MDN4104791.1 hypothetical protein [Paenibacillus polymyxa]MDN4115172.1 hypothetical protein [Paenibacillus polymyxa]